MNLIRHAQYSVTRVIFTYRLELVNNVDRFFIFIIRIIFYINRNFSFINRFIFILLSTLFRKLYDTCVVCSQYVRSFEFFGVKSLAFLNRVIYFLIITKKYTQITKTLNEHVVGVH